MPAADLETDVLILGGGVAGLWTLRRLLSRGVEAILVERNALGAGQTIASQGIIHGGLKYTLGGTGGAAAGAAGAIAGMPARWRACLDGSAGADPDLREVRILSPAQYLFTAPGFAARLAGAAASKVIRTHVARLKPPQRPPALAAAASSDVYRVEEPVLDPRSLLAALASGARGRLVHAACTSARAAPGVVLVTLQDQAGRARTIAARAVILSAGEGNADLLDHLRPAPAPDQPAAHTPAMQRRPLHMVMVRAPSLPALYAHCVGPSPRPLLTITTQHDRAGAPVWYIGGELAERGVERDEPAQVRAARDELTRLMPWIDLRDASFAALRINRAEGAAVAGARPDLPTLSPAHPEGRILAAWPTKLAFAPLLADMIEQRLREGGLVPARDAPVSDLAAHLDLPSPPIAALPWDREDLSWT